jgi:hypothetical protein
MFWVRTSAKAVIGNFLKRRLVKPAAMSAPSFIEQLLATNKLQPDFLIEGRSEL